MSIFTININPKTNQPPAINVWNVSPTNFVVDEGGDVTVNLEVQASDSDNGVLQITTQYQIPNTSTWINIETVTANGLVGVFTRTNLQSTATGVWKVRAVVTDGITTISTASVDINILVQVDVTIPDFNSNDFNSNDFNT